MKIRQPLLLGLAGLGFVLALPAQAGPITESPALIIQGLVIAAREQAEVRQEPRRDLREEERSRNNKNATVRDAERFSEKQEYGYGYERRQQPPPRRDEGGHRH